MNAVRGMAIVLIAAGVVGLAYGGFSYTKDSHAASIGSMKLTVNEKERVNVPVWAGVGAIVIGAGLLLMPPKK